MIVAALVLAATTGAYDAARRAFADRDFKHAVELYRDAAQNDPDPQRRDEALARTANIEWRIFHDLSAARKTLADATGALPLAERARAEADLAHDVATGREFATNAIAAATRRDDRHHAIVVASRIAVTAVREARLGGQCVPADSLADVQTSLEQLIDRDGPLGAPVRLLLQIAILRSDRAAMLRAWKWYYGAAPDLPNDRRALGEALAEAKFFDEAALVLADPCAAGRIDDADVRQIVAYAAALRRIGAITDEHYRQISIGNHETKEFRAAVERERQPAAEKRFRAVVRGGTTGGVDDMHYGHIVVDSNCDIEQYGHKAKLRFIALDGMVSTGYLFWMTHGESGSGGWNTREAIYQIRPMYLDRPVRDWLAVSDPEVRAQREHDIAAESSPIRATSMRMQLEADDALLASLKAKRLDGGALRSAFIERVRSDVFASSILAHEGRHAIDSHSIMSSAEREFRAKLSEVVFAPDPRRAVTGGIFVELDAQSPHGIANRRIFDGLAAWMKSSTPAIAGLAEFDKLSDDQIRAAFRSMDPLAKQ